MTMTSLNTDTSTINTLCEQFEADGYLILRDFAPAEIVKRMKESALDDVASMREPIEYEADVKYPGSPESLNSAGGNTVRRLRQAISRDPIYQELVCWPPLVNLLQKLLGSPVSCPLAHHNCVMTKHPEFSSDTGWHRDLRFWNFKQPELISVWVAMGKEHLGNGCLQVMPGTHRMQFTLDRLDERDFLDPAHPENKTLFENIVTAELEPCDVLLFHAQTFHAATRNFSDETKYSAVFTFHGPENAPAENTRSAEFPELILPVQE
ncbi:MAG: phytanoyl-CoA dioxygenase family protein [Planctomycetaceae bacterium]|nr:phytanoyl-CoA dioxygenase family protein [Planctomycetaceae bacterium]